ncbi:hypothetical protein [Chromatium okenii]|jgi:hypothetical protein|uniref:hypothetical protein n=1 Tax=Chromatium okenii TaxID=61644 RepID=UPI0026F0C4D9|nr:hypothetical protein [Chromatium okenii]MBV5308759.1 hypothetical protein [Chromatium okenii]
MLKNISSLAENFKSKITTNLNNAFDDLASSYDLAQPVPPQELLQFMELSIGEYAENYLHQSSLLAAQPIPAIPSEELLHFIELSIGKHTENYLQQLTLVAVHSGSIAETSKRLRQI